MKLVHAAMLPFHEFSWRCGKALSELNCLCSLCCFICFYCGWCHWWCLEWPDSLHSTVRPAKDSKKQRLSFRRNANAPARFSSPAEVAKICSKKNYTANEHSYQAAIRPMQNLFKNWRLRSTKLCGLYMALLSLWWRQTYFKGLVFLSAQISSGHILPLLFGSGTLVSRILMVEGLSSWKQNNGSTISKTGYQAWGANCVKASRSGAPLPEDLLTYLDHICAHCGVATTSKSNPLNWIPKLNVWIAKALPKNINILYNLPWNHVSSVLYQNVAGGIVQKFVPQAVLKKQ